MLPIPLTPSLRAASLLSALAATTLLKPLTFLLGPASVPAAVNEIMQGSLVVIPLILLGHTQGAPLICNNTIFQPGLSRTKMDLQQVTLQCRKRALGGWMTKFTSITQHSGLCAGKNAPGTSFVCVIAILLSLAMERKLSGARISRRSIFLQSQIRSQRAGFHRYECLGSRRHWSWQILLSSSVSRHVD